MLLIQDLLKLMAWLQEVRMVELNEPTGWFTIPLGVTLSVGGTTCATFVPISAFCMQVAILTNHQNGRDTHVRQVLIFGPRMDDTEAALGLPLKMSDKLAPGRLGFSLYSAIR